MELVRRHFDWLDSTHTWAKLNAHLLARDKITLVTAGGQTAGRGRFKRRWESPHGQSIYATFCFFEEKHHSDIANIPQVLALSAVKVLEDLNFAPELKWPNDVLLSKKKVAGILAETTPLSDQLCVIISIGVNVNMPLDIANKIDRPATSLLIERGIPFEVENILRLLQEQFLEDLELFRDEGFHLFLESYRRHMSFNQHIHFNDHRKIWQGKLEAIGSDGSLCMKMPDGSLKTFVAGEILWPNEIQS